MARGLLMLLCTGLLTPALSSATALTQSSAVHLTERAARLVDEGSYRLAVRELERAIAVDESYPRAYYVLGFARGRLGEHAAAVTAFLAAVRLRPAWGEAHRMAAMAAANSGQIAVAWEQAIRAHQTGVDMATVLAALADVSDPPRDLETQLAAPRVVLGALDLSRFEGFNDNPFGRETRTGNSSIGLARGQPASESSRNLTETETQAPGERRAGWATQTGAPMVAETTADMAFMMAELKRGLVESMEIGLVSDPDKAQYQIVVEVHNVARSGTDRTGGQAVSTEPRWLEGSVRIRSLATGEEVLRRPLRLTDLRSGATLRGEMAVYVRLLARWVTELQR